MPDRKVRPCLIRTADIYEAERDTMFRKLMMIFLLLFSISRMSFADEIAAKSYSLKEKNKINFSLSPTYTAELTQNKSGLMTVQVKGQKIQDLTKLKGEFNGEYKLQIDDFNFDGFADVAVSDSVGNMGLNYFYDIYFFDSKTQKFEKKIQSLGTGGEIQVDKDQKQVSGHSKSGQSMIGVFYQFQNGKPYVSLESNESQGSALVAKVYKDFTGKIIKNIITDDENSPVKAKVLLPKASLYELPKEESKTKSYLIKGDQVDLLAVSDNWQWLLIEYSGAHKIKKWMHTNELWSLTPKTELPGSFRNQNK